MLVIGLGNPGSQYAHTRHNVGWLVVDLLVERWRAREAEATATYESHTGRVADHDVTLMKPLTFMNLSGRALDEWRSRHPFETESTLVVTDDVYLPLGYIRLRGRGSSGGHRGLDSLTEALDSSDFARLRIGVGAAESSAELREHVLERFSEEEERTLEDVITEAADAVECWARDGLTAAMNRFNRRVSKEVPES